MVQSNNQSLMIMVEFGGNGYDGDGSEDGGGDEDDDGECLPLVVSGGAVEAQSNNRSLINHSTLFRPITCETCACPPKLQRSKIENTLSCYSRRTIFSA